MTFNNYWPKRYPDNSHVEEYYHKFIELQERLRKSEEERLKLEMKFNEMMQVTSEEQQLYYKRLKSQYKCFVNENQKRKERNAKILHTLERLESRAAIMESKSKRLRMLRHQYHAYLERREHERQMIRSETTAQCLKEHIDSPRLVEEKLDSLRLLSRIKQQPEDVIAEEIIQTIYERKQRRQQEQMIEKAEEVKKSHTPPKILQIQAGSDSDDDVSEKESVYPVQRGKVDKELIPEIHKSNDREVITNSCQAQYKQLGNSEKMGENSGELNKHTKEGFGEKAKCDDEKSPGSNKEPNDRNSKEIISEENFEPFNKNDDEPITKDEHNEKDEEQQQNIRMEDLNSLQECGPQEESLQMYDNTSELVENNTSNKRDENYDHSQEYVAQEEPLQAYYETGSENKAENMQMSYGVAIDDDGHVSTNVEDTYGNMEQAETSEQMYYQSENYDQMQYDENGQPLYQQDYNDQIYEQYQGYEDNAHLMSYQQSSDDNQYGIEGAHEQLPETTTTYNDNQEYVQLGSTGHEIVEEDNQEYVQLGSTGHEIVKEDNQEMSNPQSATEDQIAYSGVVEQDSNVVASNVKNQDELPMANVIQLLDTDCESESRGTANEAESVGNESDFHFSSASDSIMPGGERKTLK